MKDKSHRQRPAERSTGDAPECRQMQGKSYLALLDESPGHTREHHAEWTEKNFGYYPKW